MYYNLILDRLPNITPNGLKIRTDFRESIKFELLMQNSNIEEKDKVTLALNLYFYDINIKNEEELKKSVNDILWFYRCGKEETTSQGKETKKETSKRIYSYEFDAEYIYSAFMEQYKIDLNKEHLHWWKFKALFNSLNEEVLFSKIMSYRAIDLSKIKDKDMKKYYKKLKKIYALPDLRSEEEKENDFAEAFL